MRLSAIPQTYRHLQRLRQIIMVLSKFGLADGLSRLGPEFTYRLIRSKGGQQIAGLTFPQRIRLALSDLGPTFIKIGQILSTRPDVVGNAIADELKELQANVPPDPPEVVRRTLEAELKMPVCEAFFEFDETPLASASIAQVHRATLHSGEQVVVKVQHQGIRDVMRADLEIVAGIAALLEQHVPESRQYRPKSLVVEFDRSLKRELDFGRELHSIVEFGELFARDDGVRIPKAYRKLSTSRVLTMEYLEGPRVSQLDPRDPAIDAQYLAKKGTDIFLKMIFDHGFYHSDPHPGNIVVLRDNVVGLLDFGSTARIDDTLRGQIGEMLLCIAMGDSERLTSLIMRVGNVPLGTDRSTLHLDVADFVANYGNQPLAEFDLSGALTEMTEIIFRYGITLPARVGMLLKVLITLEGTARLLSPRFSLLEVMKPYRLKLLKARLSPKKRLAKLWHLLGDVEYLLEAFPQRIGALFAQIESGKFDIHLDHRGLEPSVNRLVIGLISSSLFLSSSILMAQRVPPLWMQHISVWGIVGIAIAALLTIRIVMAIQKSGQLTRKDKEK